MYKIGRWIMVKHDKLNPLVPPRATVHIYRWVKDINFDGYRERDDGEVHMLPFKANHLSGYSGFYTVVNSVTDQLELSLFLASCIAVHKECLP